MAHTRAMVTLRETLGRTGRGREEAAGTPDGLQPRASGCGSACGSGTRRAAISAACDVAPGESAGQPGPMDVMEPNRHRLCWGTQGGLQTQGDKGALTPPPPPLRETLRGTQALSRKQCRPRAWSGSVTHTKATVSPLRAALGPEARGVQRAQGWQCLARASSTRSARSARTGSGAASSPGFLLQHSVCGEATAGRASR